MSVTTFKEEGQSLMMSYIYIQSEETSYRTSQHLTRGTHRERFRYNCQTDLIDNIFIITTFFVTVTKWGKIS